MIYAGPAKNRPVTDQNCMCGFNDRSFAGTTTKKPVQQNGKTEEVKPQLLLLYQLQMLYVMYKVNDQAFDTKPLHLTAQKRGSSPPSLFFNIRGARGFGGPLRP